MNATNLDTGSRWDEIITKLSKMYLQNPNHSFHILSNKALNFFKPYLWWDFFEVAHGWVWNFFPSLKSIILSHIQWWTLAFLYLLYLKSSRKYINHMTLFWWHQQLFSSADISILVLEISDYCYIKKYTYRFHFYALLIILMF